MLSYSYQPRTLLFSSPEAQTPQPQHQPAHKPEDRTLETIGEDLVTFDYLIGVASLGQEYSFVQYRPTEKHKKCAGLKIDPVQQINMFIQTLREKSIATEVSLHTLVPSNKKSLWIRVSLADLTELSLEPLWRIKGRVKLYSKQRWVAITIDDLSLEPCFLDPQSQLIVAQPERNWTGEFLRLAKEGLTGHDEEDDDDSDESDNGLDPRVDSEREEPRWECNGDTVRATQKRKMCKEDEATLSRKKRKSTTGGSRVSPGSEPYGRGWNEEAKKGHDTPDVVHTNFNRGMQTRLKSRQRLHVKRGTKTVYNRKMSSPGPPTRSPVPRVHPRPTSAPREITSPVEHSDVASSHYRTARESPDDSTHPCVSAAAKQHGGDPDPESSAIPSAEILPIEHRRSPPSDPRQKQAPQHRTPECGKSRGCLLM